MLLIKGHLKSSIYDINKNAPFGNICPSLTVTKLHVSCKRLGFFFLDVEKDESPQQSQPLMLKGIH